jgi:hypothetical protein
MEASAAMAHVVNPYGDGHAGRFSYQAARIVKALSARYVESEVR